MKPLLKPLLIAALALGATVPLALAAQEDAPAPTEAKSEPKADEKTPEQKELERMKTEVEKLQTEYQLKQQRVKNQLLDSDLEKQELGSRAGLIEAKQKNELLSSNLEKQELTIRAGLRDAQQADELAAIRASSAKLEAETAALRAEMSFRQAQRDQELEDLQASIKNQQIEKQLKDLTHQEQLAELRAQAERIAAENGLQAQELAASQTSLQILQQNNLTTIAELDNLLKVRSARDKVKSKILKDIDYIAEPFQDGTLYISDRRISLNGPIWEGTADYITERIHFYNNQSHDYPIFIVIDDCPGGSVMEGYRIVKAIESSPAPVHVVVKSFAASMAAVITTLADHSYAYPNAIILHHQMSSGMRGNLTQQAEQLENGFEWAKRLADPVAAKMGVSYDEFTELMYENNSDGDWFEFADKAVELKWVNNMVNQIQEAGIRNQPKGGRSSFPWFFDFMETDTAGNKFIRMPPLRPFDHYFIYDPNDFYRM